MRRPILFLHHLSSFQELTVHDGAFCRAFCSFSVNSFATFLVIFLYFSRKRWSTYTASEAGRFQSRITLDIERWTRGILRDGIICCRPQSSCSWSADSATGLSAWLCCESWYEYICGVKKTTGNRLHCLILSDFFFNLVLSAYGLNKWNCFNL